MSRRTMLEYECAAWISSPNVTLEADNDENKIGCIARIQYAVSEFELLRLRWMFYIWIIYNASPDLNG